MGMFRLGALLLAAALAFGGQARAETLDQFAGRLLEAGLPATMAQTPQRLEIDPAFRDALLAEPLDGGREKSIFIKYVGGRLVIDQVVAGQRYRATGQCTNCDYPRPIFAHTHPYENPLSVVDLQLAAERRQASIAVAHGALYMAVPTLESRAIAVSDNSEWIDYRYAVFGNRLQCPARTPPGGWVSPTSMSRNVEAVMRAAAHDLKIALYVLQGGAFERLPDFDHGIAVFDRDRPLKLTDFNAYELTLLRTASLMTFDRFMAEGRITSRLDTLAPTTPDPFFEGRLASAEPGDEEDNAAVRGALRFAANNTANAGDYWFGPLPTTVYLQSVSDQSIRSVPFISVQMSRDCRDIWVLQGEQDFAPDGVRYQRGWSRRANAPGRWNEGWTDLDPARFPKGDKVPW